MTLEEFLKLCRTEPATKIYNLAPGIIDSAYDWRAAIAEHTDYTVDLCTCLGDINVAYMRAKNLFGSEFDQMLQRTYDEF